MSLFSLIASIVLKYLGIDWFDLQNYRFEIENIPKYIINSIILILQYMLIVGCVNRYNFKELFIKLLPYFPIVVILYFLPKEFYCILNCIILFTTCMSLRPRFSTIISFIVNITCISLIQIILLWIKLDISNLVPVSLGLIDFLIVNIDQFIMLALLYYINRKWGDKFDKLVIFRGKR